MVPQAGLEPARSCEQQIFSLPVGRWEHNWFSYWRSLCLFLSVFIDIEPATNYGSPAIEYSLAIGDTSETAKEVG
jgi:hypothetical protein